MSAESQALARSFLAGELDPAAFRHVDHVRVAYEMLLGSDFLAASTRYSVGLKALAEKAGVPEKFNATMTLAFLSVIAERMRARSYVDCEAFVSDNRDLLSRDLLTQWYTPERLGSDLARRVFLMPDRPRTGSDRGDLPEPLGP